MFERLPLLFRHVTYALRGGFLVRPLVISVTLGVTGMVLSSLEESFPILSDWVPAILFPSHSDAQVAQVMLGTTASSVMTVVSIVFAILLMTLTLASMQFSPRILVSFVKDRVTQWTLGIFLGTFLYCLCALPAARSAPIAFAPVLTVTGAMLLALASAVGLIFFIHHISQAISVTHIVDRIAREAEDVIDDLMPHKRANIHRAPPLTFEAKGPEHEVRSRVSGYIRFVDTARLLNLAKSYRLRVRVLRRVGHFIPEGVPLFSVSREDRMSSERSAELISAFDIGPARTMQQDVEFGILQIVDIALKAISPAVNDPSTAINCIDQLGRILIRWASREPPPSQLCHPPHVVRVVIPWIGFLGLLDTAFEQIRHYAASDVVVSLRLLRALDDVASTLASEEMRAELASRGRRIVEGCAARLGAEDVGRLEQRLSALEGRFAAPELSFTSP
ncbi:Uncharacterized membrane protein [Rhizobiales bacterium GAS191]|nr:Uncharacterized membrane protein [Rhizobiales bacterium GAS113]SEC65749.1 Uncharacterized membrane protein [Rhizobiales bacterium GAS191]